MDDSVILQAANHAAEASKAASDGWLFEVVYAIVAFLLGLLMTIIGFFTREIFKDVKDLKESRQDCELNLANHRTDLVNYKTEVANTYSKEAVTQQALARVHDRLDAMGSKIDDLGETMGDKMDGIRNLLVARAK